MASDKSLASGIDPEAHSTEITTGDNGNRLHPGGLDNGRKQRLRMVIAKNSMGDPYMRDSGAADSSWSSRNRHLSVLRSRRTAGAGLDFIAHESQVPEELFHMKNVILTPHLGGGTLRAEEATGVAAFFAGDAFADLVASARSAAA